MPQIIGSVIKVALDVDEVAKSGSVYKAWKLVYKDDEGRVKDVTKPMQGLTYNPALKASLESLASGDNFTLFYEKNEKGFNDVKSIAKSGEMHSMPPSKPAAGKVTGSNYETPAERSARQVYIVRQSSLSNAIALLKTEKFTPPAEDVCQLAEVFVNFVFKKDD